MSASLITCSSLTVHQGAPFEFKFVITIWYPFVSCDDAVCAVNSYEGSVVRYLLEMRRETNANAGLLLTAPEPPVVVPK